MGSAENKEGLISFLNAVLSKTRKEKIEDVEIIENKQLAKKLILDKTGRLDVRARLSDKTEIDIEVQLTDYKNMDKRTLFYWGKLFLEGIKKGNDYNELNSVITINLLDFPFLKTEKFHNSFSLWEDEERDFKLGDLINIHFIEMPKFLKLAKKDLNDPLQRWLKFFDKTVRENELKELMTMDSVIAKTEETLEYLSSDEDTLALIEARENAKIEYNSQISAARREEREKAEQEKKELEKKAEEEKKKAEEEKKKAEEEKKKAEEEKIEMAKEMLADDHPIEKIIKYTKLPEHLIKKLQEELK